MSSSYDNKAFELEWRERIKSYIVPDNLKTSPINNFLGNKTSENYYVKIDKYGGKMYDGIHLTNYNLIQVFRKEGNEKVYEVPTHHPYFSFFKKDNCEWFMCGYTYTCPIFVNLDKRETYDMLELPNFEKGCCLWEGISVSPDGNTFCVYNHYGGNTSYGLFDFSEPQNGPYRLEIIDKAHHKWFRDYERIYTYLSEKWLDDSRFEEVLIDCNFCPHGFENSGVIECEECIKSDNHEDTNYIVARRVLEKQEDCMVVVEEEFTQSFHDKIGKVGEIEYKESEFKDQSEYYQKINELIVNLGLKEFTSCDYKQSLKPYEFQIKSTPYSYVVQMSIYREDGPDKKWIPFDYKLVWNTYPDDEKIQLCKGSGGILECETKKECSLDEVLQMLTDFANREEGQEEPVELVN